LKRKYKIHKNIRIVSTTRKNISLARNVGVLLAKGDFLVFIDSDCIIDKKYIEVLIKVHDKQDAIRGKLIYDSGNTKFDRNYSWLRSYFNDNYVSNPYTPNLVIKKDIYRLVGLYNEDLSGAEDSEWSQRFNEYEQNKANYVSNLIVTHGLDDPKKAPKTWMLYGLGRSYQAKKSLEFYKTPLLFSLKKAFSELNLLKAFQSENRNSFIFNYDLRKSIGFFYGWFFKWRKYDKLKFIKIDKYYKSREYELKVLHSAINVS
jgi:glycosyltransferase involved in cell wall biosynthesis